MKIADFRLGQFAEWSRGFDEGVDLVQVDEAVPIRSRHLVIDLSNHITGTLSRRERGIHADANCKIRDGQVEKPE